VRDDELRTTLTAANPWWRAPAAGTDPTAWVTNDRLLRRKRELDIGFRSTILDDVAARPDTDSLVLLQGPRRVGKSVTLRELAMRLCQRPDLDPRQIVTFSCDAMTGQDLTRAIRLARDLTRSVDTGGTRPRIWLVDEVGMARGWAARIKALRDGSDLGDETLVLTSSSWRSEEDVQGNLLAGRAGSSGLRRVRMLMPMTFGNYLACTRGDTARLDAVAPQDLQTQPVRDALDSVMFDVDAYDLAWQDYLTSGGFPRAVSEALRNGAPSPDYVADLVSWLSRDVEPDAPQESITRLLEGVMVRATSPMNVVKAADDLGYSTRDVFSRRLDRLVTSYAAIWVPRRNDAGQLVGRSQRKLYLTDPLLAWLPATLSSGCVRPDISQLSEQVLGVSLARAIDRLQEGRWLSGDTVGYARTDAGNEVDFAPVRVPGAAQASLTTPIESKWVTRGWKSEARTIKAKYGCGIVATKNILDTSESVWAVPAPLVAMLLG
jgi:hypothetical protein